MVEKDVIVSYYRKRSRDLSLAFKIERPPCYCHDMEEPFQTLGVVHIVKEWRAFIDSSKRILQFFYVSEIKYPPSLLHTLPC